MKTMDKKSLNLAIEGFDRYFEKPELDASIMKLRISTAIEKSLPFERIADKEIRISISEMNHKEEVKAAKISRIIENKRNYIAQAPNWSIEQVILPKSTRLNLEKALLVLSHNKLIFEEWNLKSIIPNARTALNFFGHPGTGKTMCAHAIANKLRKNIMCLNYAQIESKFVGDAPKNLDAAFAEAKGSDSVLFFDEADSLLGKRISNVSNGSEQAINSLRSQMLIAIESFAGVVIFATNFIENYDIAFESRIQSIFFDLPDMEARMSIWNKHLPPELPLSDDVKVDYLASKFNDFSGRDIRNAVLGAVTDALQNMQNNKVEISQHNFIASCKNIIATRFSKNPSNISEADKDRIKSAIAQKLKDQA